MARIVRGVAFYRTINGQVNFTDNHFVPYTHKVKNDTRKNAYTSGEVMLSSLLTLNK